MTRETLHIDFETRSTIDINRAGAERYMECPHFSILCMAYAFGDGPVGLWIPSQSPMPSAVREHVEAGGPVAAHNAAFEMLAWAEARRRDPAGWPELRIYQVDDTMARARAMGLPGSLGDCAVALRMPIEKDNNGRRVMLRVCKPQKRGGEYYWINDPALFQRLYEYCKRDVEVEREIDKRLPPLSPDERAVWEMDWAINQRGVRVDVRSVSGALEAVAEEGRALSLAVSKLTDGAATATKRAKLLEWLRAKGLDLKDMRKGTIAAALESAEAMASSLREPPAQDVSPALARFGVTPEDLERQRDEEAESFEAVCKVLRLRQEGSKASTAKLAAMAKGTCLDGRARGLYAYHGAGPGRWAGRRIQTQNMPRTPKGFKVRDAEVVFQILNEYRGNARRLLRAEFGSTMDAVSWSLRSLLIADPDKRFICGDYSNIEGRGIAWLAGEDWKIEAFEAFDRKEGPDIYKLAFSEAFGIPVDEVDEYMRQIGKVMELALGYQGSIRAFIEMAKGYGVDLEALAKIIRGKAAPAEWERYSEAFDKETVKDRHGLEPHVWVAIKIVVMRWRDAHPNIRKFWYDLERAAIEAVASPGTVTRVGHIRYVCREGWLYCRLPSGRCIAYPYPELSRSVDKWGRPKTALTVYGVDQGRFVRYHVYGGLLAENVTQATARDVLAAAMLRLEAAGYPIVMHVHDEILAEVLKAFGTVEEFVRIMEERPDWAHGFPITVGEPWEGMRYRK